VWILLDERGRFTHTFEGELESLAVGTGIGFGLRRFGSRQLQEAMSGGQIELGNIDLRALLESHSMEIRSADGRSGVVRIGMWSGPPPDGVALGSRQFPPVPIDSEVEWLVPPNASSIYFLVERPAESTGGAGGVWREGEQYRFGPFEASALPTTLELPDND